MACLLLTSSADTIFGSMRLLPLCYIMCSQLRKAGPSVSSHKPAQAMGIQALSLPKYPILPLCSSATASSGGPKSPDYRILTILKAQAPVLLASPEQPRVPLCSTPHGPYPSGHGELELSSLGPQQDFPQTHSFSPPWGNWTPRILSSLPIQWASLSREPTLPTSQNPKPRGSVLKSDLTQREKLLYPKRICQRRHLKYHLIPLFI